MTADDQNAIQEMLRTELEPVKRELTEVSAKLISCQARREHCTTVQRDLARDMWGNGRDGVRDRVRDLEATRAGALKMLGIFLTAAGVGGTIAGVIVALVK